MVPAFSILLHLAHSLTAPTRSLHPRAHLTKHEFESCAGQLSPLCAAGCGSIDEAGNTMMIGQGKERRKMPTLEDRIKCTTNVKSAKRFYPITREAQDLSLHAKAHRGVRICTESHQTHPAQKGSTRTALPGLPNQMKREDLENANKGRGMLGWGRRAEELCREAEQVVSGNVAVTRPNRTLLGGRSFVNDVGPQPVGHDRSGQATGRPLGGRPVPAAGARSHSEPPRKNQRFSTYLPHI